MAAFDHRKPETLPGMGGVAAGTIPAPKVIRAMFNEPLERPRYEPKPRSTPSAPRTRASRPRSSPSSRARKSARRTSSR
jgi:hypothetical protein